METLQVGGAAFVSILCDWSGVHVWGSQVGPMLEERAKLGKLSVININHILAISDQLSHGCVQSPGLVLTDSTLTSWIGYSGEQPGFLDWSLQVVGQGLFLYMSWPYTDAIYRWHHRLNGHEFE